QAVPLRLRPAVRHVRARFDREALRGAVDDPTDVAFLGVATHHRRTDYAWDRIPPFLGTDVWTGTGDRFRPPDAAKAIFEGTGLDAVDAVEREVHARDFDPDAYEIPESAWYDGPAAGVVVRNKRGERGRLVRIELDDGTPGPLGDEAPDVEAIAAEYATNERLERYRKTIERHGEPATVDAIADRVVEAVAREEPTRIRVEAGHSSGDDAPTRSRPVVDASRLREVAVGRAQTFLAERSESG
ncbi:RNA ligase family protein, partial [Halorubrum sp. AD140]|uniref:RNA ligase family protein n=1 Tax=Halorubrum sp. AD140 TaxID=3050073 RepID=UPI002ACCB985